MTATGGRVRLHYVDFDGLRTGATIRDLPLARLGFSAVRVPLPDSSAALRLDRPEDYVGAVAEGLDAPPTVLIGYCAGVEVARRLAVELGAVGSPPRLVIAIDPEPEDADAKSKQYRLLLGQLGAEADSAVTLEAMRASLERAYDSFVKALPEVDQHLFVEERKATLDRYVDWLAFVGAGSTAPPAVAEVPVRVLLSRDVQAPVWAQRSGLVRVGAEQERLLATEEAAVVLSGMAREVGVTPVRVANGGSS